MGAFAHPFIGFGDILLTDWVTVFHIIFFHNYLHCFIMRSLNQRMTFITHGNSQWESRGWVEHQIQRRLFGHRQIWFQENRRKYPYLPFTNICFVGRHFWTHTKRFTFTMSWAFSSVHALTQRKRLWRVRNRNANYLADTRSNKKNYRAVRAYNVALINCKNWANNCAVQRPHTLQESI